MEEENNKRGITLSDAIKFIGVIGIVTPLLLGYFQYQRSVQQDKDNNFRVWVEKLSSEKRADRISAATNLGTYLKTDDDYNEEALDVLINTVAIELDYNVLNAIRGSLEKAGVSERTRINQKILDMDRDIFNFDYPLKTWLDSAKANLKLSENKLKYEALFLSNNSSDVVKLILNPLAEDLKIKNEIKINVERDYNELNARSLLFSTFITLSLELSRSNPIEGLSFYQNSFNYLVWLNFQIPNSKMENSAFSEMILTNIDLSRSKIIGTTFQGTNFTNCSFAGSEINATNFTGINVKDTIDFRGASFDDVFFQGSDLKYSNFKGATGLKPIYFYKVKNLGNVQFDDDFRRELENTFITDQQFINYIYDCKLMKLRANELYDVLFPQN
jgi:uncharacterized protein YjbI with pentapeptide repeats